MKGKKLRKVLSAVLAAALLVGCLGACAGPDPAESEITPSKTESSKQASSTPVESEAEESSEAPQAPEEAAIPTSFQEAPVLKEKVDKGELPPVEERLPENPLVVPPVDKVGEYGGVLRVYAPSTDSFDDMHWVREANWLKKKSHSYFDEGENGTVLHRAAAFEANSDMTEFTVSLRKGLKWSDGTPVTTEDIRFAAEDVWMNADLNFWWYSWLSDNRPEVQIVDETTIKFVFQAPAPAFMKDQTGWGSNQGLGVGEVPSTYLKQFHITYNPKADEEAKAEGYESWVDRYEDISNCGDSQTNLDLPTVNAWVLKSKSTSQRVYERNPYYWMVDTAGNQLPYIDGYVVNVVADMEVAKLKLIAGEFDMAGQFLIQLSEYPMLKQNETAGGYTIKLAQGSSTGKPIVAPNFNHKDPVLREIFSNPDFRKALSYAINREEISQIAFAGLAEPMQLIYPLSEHFNSDEYRTMYTEFNPDKARELLDGMGLEKDENGDYLRPDGALLTINLQTIVEEGWGEAAELVAKHWTDVGVKTQYNPIDRTLFGERNTANELDIWVWQGSSPSEADWVGNWDNWQLNEKAWDWDKWFKSAGAEGEEPPQEWKDYYENVQALFKAAYGSQEYMDLMKKVWDFRIKDQLYCIGTVGNFPNPLLVKNGLENVGNLEVPFDYWQGQYPEQFYWSDSARRAELVP